MDIGKAVGFVFEDEQWISKLLLGALITLIPIFGQFVLLGYGVAIVRSIKAGEPRLPGWDKLGRYFVEGLTFWVAALVYTIPLLIFICPVALISALPALAGENQDLAPLLAGVSGVVTIASGCLATLYAILLGLLTPALQIRYADTGELGACLRFGEIFRFLLDNIGDIVIAQVLVWLAGSLVVALVGGVTCGLLALPASVWLTAFSSHLYGQIGRRAETA